MVSVPSYGAMIRHLEYQLEEEKKLKTFYKNKADNQAILLRTTHNKLVNSFTTIKTLRNAEKINAAKIETLTTDLHNQAVEANEEHSENQDTIQNLINQLIRLWNHSENEIRIARKLQSEAERREPKTNGNGLTLAERIIQRQSLISRKMKKIVEKHDRDSVSSKDERSE